MYWNDRVFKNYEAQYDYTYYTIQEVYYNEADEIVGYVDAKDGKAPYGDDVDELKWVLTRMLEATEKPVIDKAELESYFNELRMANDNVPQDPEGPNEVFDSVEELLAALEEDSNDADSESGS